MKISIIDGSNYFKALLLLIRKDHQVSDPEVKLIKHIGKSFGFDQEFCDGAIRDILKNECINETPPVFSSKEIAAKFIKDGLSIAYSDHDQIDKFEEDWLRLIASKNSLDPKWFVQEQQDAIKRNRPLDKMEADDLTVEYVYNNYR